MCVGGGGDRGEMRWGWRGAADPLHPAEAAVYTGLTLQNRYTHTLTQANTPFIPLLTLSAHIRLQSV